MGVLLPPQELPPRSPGFIKATLKTNTHRSLMNMQSVLSTQFSGSRWAPVSFQSTPTHCHTGLFPPLALITSASRRLSSSPTERIRPSSTALLSHLTANTICIQDFCVRIGGLYPPNYATGESKFEPLPGVEERSVDFEGSQEFSGFLPLSLPTRVAIESELNAADPSQFPLIQSYSSHAQLATFLTRRRRNSGYETQEPRYGLPGTGRSSCLDPSCNSLYANQGSSLGSAGGPSTLRHVSVLTFCMLSSSIKDQKAGASLNTNYRLFLFSKEPSGEEKAAFGVSSSSPFKPLLAHL